MLLGGSASPIGWWVGFVEAPADRVLQELVTWRTSLGQELEVSEPRGFPDCLESLVPLEAPWTRELVFACGSWTAYLNNFRLGGDPSGGAAVLSGRLACRGVAASHTPRHGPGHAGTQLWVYESGTYVRTIDAVAADGRWSWYESGTVQDFEEPERYRARRKRDRLDRELLVTYLQRLGIPVDEEASYGPGTTVVRQVTWKRVQQTLEEARRELGIDQVGLE
jgi:hypothetical protein